MFCSKCGKQILDDANFCKFCGANVDGNKMGEANASSGMSLIDPRELGQKIRKGTLLYLQDVLAMEFSINKLMRHWRCKMDALSIHDDWFFWQCYELKPCIVRGDTRYRYMYLSYSYKNKSIYYGFENTHMQAITLYDYKLKPVKHRFGTPCTTLLSDERRSKLCTLPKLKNSFFSDWPIITNQEQTDWEPYELAKADWRLETFAQVKIIIERFEAEVREHENRFQEHAPKLRKDIENLSNEIKRAKEILKGLYSANLIPAKYRNIGCAYFIYDFFSTSNVPLENVFLHLDLDKIQAQLNAVIKNQQESILRQAAIMAQNEELISQNQALFEELSRVGVEISDKLSDIHESAVDVAQWTQIAAYNAEACAWIGLANFFK